MKISPFLSLINRWKAKIIAIAFFLWAMYLRIYLLATNPPGASGDSVWQVSFFNGKNSFWDLLKDLPNADHAGYLAGDFVLIYPFFKMFGNNQWGLAAPHLMAAILGFYFLYLICKKYCQTLFGYLIAFLITCFNYNLIFHSVEIRVYAVLPTLALMSLYFSLELAEKNVRMTLRQRIIAAIVFIGTIWFHAYGILIVCCTALFALLSMPRDKQFMVVFKEYFKFFAVVCIIAMPLWCYSVFGPHFSMSREHSIARNIGTFDYIPNPMVSFNRFSRTIFGNLLGFKKVKFLVNGLILALLVPHKERWAQAGFFFLLIALPLQLLLMADLSKSYWFVQRQFTWVMPLFAILVAWCWDSLIAMFVNHPRLNRYLRFVAVKTE